MHIRFISSKVKFPISNLPFRTLFGCCLFVFCFGLAFQLIHNGFFLFPFLPMNGVSQVHQGNGLTASGLLFQLCHRRLFCTIVDDAVDHAVIAVSYTHLSTLAQFLQEQKKDRHTEEVEAESISYAVCKYFGIETGENSFGYIASWSQGKELKELRASLETINKTSGTLISDIERHYKEICKERGIDPNAKKEPEMAVLDAEANQQEALFLIDDATYLHIQPCDSGWDYTIYDAASMKELDGGQLDMPELSRMKAVLQICDDNDLGKDSVKYAPLFMIETLQEAAYQQMQAEVRQMTASSQLPEAQEQALDEYPMPDEQVSTPDMQEYGYSYDGMLPVRCV